MNTFTKGDKFFLKSILLLLSIIVISILTNCNTNSYKYDNSDISYDYNNDTITINSNNHNINKDNDERISKRLVLPNLGEAMRDQDLGKGYGYIGNENIGNNKCDKEINSLGQLEEIEKRNKINKNK